MKSILTKGLYSQPVHTKFKLQSEVRPTVVQSLVDKTQQYTNPTVFINRTQNFSFP